MWLIISSIRCARSAGWAGRTGRGGRLRVAMVGISVKLRINSGMSPCQAVDVCEEMFDRRPLARRWFRVQPQPSSSRQMTQGQGGSMKRSSIVSVALLVLGAVSSARARRRRQDSPPAPAATAPAAAPAPAAAAAPAARQQHAAPRPIADEDRSRSARPPFRPSRRCPRPHAGASPPPPAGTTATWWGHAAWVITTPGRRDHRDRSLARQPARRPRSISPRRSTPSWSRTVTATTWATPPSSPRRPAPR